MVRWFVFHINVFTCDQMRLSYVKVGWNWIHHWFKEVNPPVPEPCICGSRRLCANTSFYSIRDLIVRSARYAKFRLVRMSANGSRVPRLGLCWWIKCNRRFKIKMASDKPGIIWIFQNKLQQLYGLEKKCKYLKAF